MLFLFFILLLMEPLLNFAWWDDFPSRKSHQSRDPHPHTSCEICLKMRESAYVCVSKINLFFSVFLTHLPAFLLWDALIHPGSDYMKPYDFSNNWEVTDGPIGTNLGFIELPGHYRRSDISWSCGRPSEYYTHARINTIHPPAWVHGHLYRKKAWILHLKSYYYTCAHVGGWEHVIFMRFCFIRDHIQ